MKRIIASLAAIAMMAGAAPAFAGTIVTPSPSTFTLTGAVTVSQSVTLNCMLTLNVAVDAAGNANITGGSLAPNSSALCSSVILANFNWPISATAPTSPSGAAATQLSIANFRANTLTGNCAGTLVVAWDNTNKEATVNSTVPGTSLGASKACVIAGKLKSSNPSVSINIT
ncbi:hypothetical protein [Brevundimonas sp.]|uniref:hypothetical protein n=1 Tax=Brevundimonas sp. TaxID=1871086 RepID=UPI0028A055B7|nr:hypothetical protein [Brevundimonas sp.]